MPATVAFAYAGAVSEHTDPGQYDPRTYHYLDGASVADPWSQPVKWAGVADNSVTEVVPKLPAGWQYTQSTDAYNLHVLESSRMVWTTLPAGRLGGMLRVGQTESASVRTVGLPVGDNHYVSGEITVNTRPSSSVDVQVYGAPDESASGTLLFTYTLGYTQDGDETVEWHDLPITDPFVYLQLTYTESSNAAGYPVQFDNLLMLPTSDPLGNNYPGYFDGSTADGGWTGQANASTSKYFGGSRRCLAEVVEAIDMTSMAGGTRAEFSVAMVVPGAFWEDMIENTFTFPVDGASLLLPSKDPAGLAGLGVTLDQLAAGTAPIDDALITLQVTGSVSNLLLTDVATGAWLKISGTLPTVGPIVISNALFTVRNYPTPTTFNSLMASVTRGGSNQLLPVTPQSSVTAPAMQFSATGGGSLSVTITARRRYVIA